MSHPAVEAERLVRTFSVPEVGTIVAADDVSFRIAKGSSLGLIGESGSGKSTIGRLVLGLLPSDSGVIRVAGQPVDPADPKGLKELRARVGAVFQEPYESLNPRQRVGRVVRESLDIHRRELSKDDRAELVATALDQVGLPRHTADRYPHALSGGEQQRVGIARALVNSPDVIVLDEPTSSLDVSIRAQILELLAELRERLAVTYLYISHDMDTVSYLCEQVAVLYRGRIVERGEAQQILDRPVHPYTEALVSSRLSPVPGTKPAFIDLRPSPPQAALTSRPTCVLLGSCPLEIDACHRGRVRLERLEDGREVACVVRAAAPAEKGGPEHPTEQ